MSGSKTPREALVLVAHADDETLGCGGTIARLTGRDWRVRVVILSSGQVVVRSAQTDNRSHARKACQMLGAEPPVFLGFEDQKFDTLAVADLANAVSALQLRPELVITHAPTDLNLDHRIVCDIAKIIGRPTRAPVTLLACEVPATTFWNANAFAADLFVDIGDHLDTKIAAFACYVNEQHEAPHPWSPEGLRTLGRYHGIQAGLPAAEAFTVIRAYGAHLADL